MDMNMVKNTYKHTLYDNAIKARLDYYKRLKDELEAHKSKAENILLRKKMLDAQRKHNYQLEYDRIRGDLLTNSIIPRTRKHLEKRKLELQALGAKAIDGINP